MIYCKPRANVFTISQFQTLRVDDLFPKSNPIYHIYEFYFEGYQIALHINNFPITQLWKNDNDENLFFVSDSTNVRLPNEVENYTVLTLFGDEVLCFCNKKIKISCSMNFPDGMVFYFRNVSYLKEAQLTRERNGRMKIGIFFIFFFWRERCFVFSVIKCYTAINF